MVVLTANEQELIKKYFIPKKLPNKQYVLLQTDV